MKPFRWAFVIATLFTIHRWLLASHEQLSAWAQNSDALETLVVTVQALLGGPAAIVFLLATRKENTDVLASANRRRIHDYVSRNPGVSLSEISAALGIGWGTSVHHVERMEKARVLRSYADGRRRAFVVEGQRANSGDASLPRTDPTRARLLQAIRLAPGASQGELARSAGLSLSLASRHLGVLERAGLVASHKTWRTRTYELSVGASSQSSPMENRHSCPLSSVSPRGTSVG